MTVLDHTAGSIGWKACWPVSGPERKTGEGSIQGLLRTETLPAAPTTMVDCRIP